MKTLSFIPTPEPSLYEAVTDQIVAAIAAGAGAYRMPWHLTGEFPELPLNAATGRPYRGLNILTLWSLATGRGYPTGEWATWRQWQTLGAQVRSAEQAARVFYWKVTGRRAQGTEEAELSAEEEAGSGPPRAPRRRFLLREYCVFNAAQVENYTPSVRPRLAESERIERAEEFFAALGADIHHGGNEASYCPQTDTIRMPLFGAFRDPLSYYGTLAHETVHWAGAAQRLDRNLTTRFGSAAYAMEELVAELGGAFLAAALGLSPQPRSDHAAYVGEWLNVLRHDARALFTAAAKAQQAVDWLMAIAPKQG